VIAGMNYSTVPKLKNVRVHRANVFGYEGLLRSWHISQNEPFALAVSSSQKDEELVLRRNPILGDETVRTGKKGVRGRGRESGKLEGLKTKKKLAPIPKE